MKFFFEIFFCFFFFESEIVIILINKQVFSVIAGLTSSPSVVSPVNAIILADVIVIFRTKITETVD